LVEKIERATVCPRLQPCWYVYWVLFQLSCPHDIWRQTPNSKTLWYVAKYITCLDAQCENITHMILGGMVIFFGIVVFLILAMNGSMRGEVSVPPAAYEFVYEVLMRWDEGT
jgi:hypothetical protein